MHQEALILLGKRKKPNSPIKNAQKFFEIFIQGDFLKAKEDYF